MQQIFYWADIGDSVLWLAGTESRNYSGSISYRAILPLELWRLSKPYDSAAMDWRIIFPDIFYFQSRAAKKGYNVRNAVKPSVYGLVRCCAALTGTALLALVVILLAIVFYGQMFHWYDWSSLLLPTFLTLVPPLIFALGSGWRLGRLSAWLLFVWMLVPILLMTLPLPEFLGLLNGNVFVERPLTLNILDPAFSLSIGTVITQCVLLLTGILFLVVSPTKSKKH